ncbi:MAG: hypothetical protein AB1486_22455 [Planctomycetota bacterium]
MVTSEKRFLCRHLYTKAMGVFGAGCVPSGPKDPDPCSAHTMDVGYAWCNRTLRAIGPDDCPVLPEECIEGRPCFERGRRV